ncbi:hypothetical protein HF888_04010 [Bermanella marisrubri]|uniref:Uncharacterized protein n=1 Tax=Bermanella marisrubri TaxID=207949 RepID=Q1MYU4_9GAMM|nr:hypothetical protein [Bermanella marisrubri]EAT11112.1 hypothetical protein RED65_04939 [Oceanobacter sp. RED65] [Bermanella marisrubri]QIZ83440.1 hypothetical protein HF888_04010 [Bermanella marisrubri]
MAQSQNPNPQGKGLVSVLTHIGQMQPSHVIAKTAKAWWADYFTSVLVLNAEFSFQPKQNQSYYLYLHGSRWKLSLIEPQDWGLKKDGINDNNHSRIFFARCNLNSDMTWTLEPDANALEDQRIQQALNEFQRQFVADKNSEQDISNQLPFFIESLPFYRKLGATALAKSLQSSYEQTQHLNGGHGQATQNWFLPLQNPTLMLSNDEYEKEDTV